MCAFCFLAGTAAPILTINLAIAASTASAVAIGHSTRLTVCLNGTIVAGTWRLTGGTHAEIRVASVHSAAARVAVDRILVSARPVTWLSSTAICI